jgi:hypothetical protein
MPMSGPPTDLRAAPDGSFTARLTVKPGGKYVVEAYGKWGGSIRGERAIAEPRVQPAFPAGVFGDGGVSLAGRGVVDAFDSNVGPYGPGTLVAGADVVGSNGNISIGASVATGSGQNGRAPAPAPGPAVAVGPPSGPAFVGAIYAPLADFNVHMQGGASSANLANGKQEIAGNVVPGVNVAVTIAGPCDVQGSTVPRPGAAALPPVQIVPPVGPIAPIAVASGTQTIGPGAVDCAGVSVAAGGTLEITGAVEMRCMGDFAVAGALVLDAGATLHVVLTGKLAIADGCLVNPGTAAAARFDLAYDSSKAGAGALDIFCNSFIGAIAARSVKVTGTPIEMHLDCALRPAPAGPVVYRATNVVEIAPPWGH